jgi:sugar/nucleoside kinase (ribokinase family)
MRFDLCIIGDINIDYLGSAPRFPGPDEEVELSSLGAYLGGSGANAAVAASKLNLSVAFYSAAGTDAIGAELIRQLERAGVSPQFVIRVEDVPSGLVFGAISPDGVRRLFAFRGANLSLMADHISDEVLRSSRRLHLNGPEYTVGLELSARARKHRIPNSIDPGSILIDQHQHEMDALLALTDILFVNSMEFEALAHGANSTEKALDLHRRGAKWVAVKQGAAGSVIYRQGLPPQVMPALPIKAVDSTGAGDAFNAAFLYGLLNGYSVEAAQIIANAVGALAASASGATMGVPGTIQEVFDFIERSGYALEMRRDKTE